MDVVDEGVIWAWWPKQSRVPIVRVDDQWQSHQSNRAVEHLLVRRNTRGHIHYLEYHILIAPTLPSARIQDELPPLEM